MTRYVIAVGSSWLTALYDLTSNGIGRTSNKNDASSWSTYEKAQETALRIRGIFSEEIRIEAREEPAYPRCWDVVSRSA